MISIVLGIIGFIKADFKAWPLRFTLEVSAWLASIGCSITMANPPFLILYPIFIIQCIIFGWSAWTRKSFGMLSNYLLLVSIDTVGLIRLIYNT